MVFFPGFLVVGLSEAPRFLYGRTLRDSPIPEWLDFWRPLGCRMVELLEALDFCMVGHLESSRFLYG